MAIFPLRSVNVRFGAALLSVRVLVAALALMLGIGGLTASAHADTDVAAASVPAKCTGRFVNPITDVCWSCLFPLSVGALKIFPGERPDTDNPSLPVCACGSPLPRIGFAFGFWEPVRLADVTMKPWCF